jgi:hypothetical protein
MLSILVSTGQRNLHVEHAAGPIQFGRRPQRKESKTGQPIRRVPLEDLYASRDHLRVEEQPGWRVRLENLSTRWPVSLNNAGQVPAGGSWESPLPVKATVGQTVITLTSKGYPGAPPGPLGSFPGESGIAPGPTGDEAFAAGGFRTIAPPITRLRAGQTILALPMNDQEVGPQAPVTSLGESPSLETLARWLETVLAPQRSSASPAEFFRPDNPGDD